MTPKKIGLLGFLPQLGGSSQSHLQNSGDLYSDDLGLGILFLGALCHRKKTAENFYRKFRSRTTGQTAFHSDFAKSVQMAVVGREGGGEVGGGALGHMITVRNTFRRHKWHYPDEKARQKWHCYSTMHIR